MPQANASAHGEPPVPLIEPPSAQTRRRSDRTWQHPAAPGSTRQHPAARSPRASHKGQRAGGRHEAGVCHTCATHTGDASQSEARPLAAPRPPARANSGVYCSPRSEFTCRIGIPTFLLFCMFLFVFLITECCGFKYVKAVFCCFFWYTSLQRQQDPGTR